MPDPIPRNINPKDLGIAVAEKISGQSGKPFVLHDNRGLIKWSVSGNTVEQNEQIGIRNIQGLFLEKFPEFNQLFPRDETGQIPPEKREEAKKFIMDKIGNYRGFKTAFSDTPRQPNVAPYFEGKHSVVVAKSFSPWGLVFETLPQEDRRSQRYLDQQGESWTTQKSFGRRYGIDSKTLKSRSEGIKTIEGKAIGGKTTHLYNEKDLAERFRDAIGLKKLPQVSRKTGAYVDEKNTRWVTLGYFAEVHGVNGKIFSRYVKDVRTIEGRSKSGGAAILYDETAAMLQLKDFFSSRFLPQVDKKSGQYINENGDAWAALNYFHRQHKLSYEVLKSRLEDIDVVMGLDKSGRQVVLYKVNEAQTRLEEIISLPQIDQKTGKYSDSSGRVWVPERNIRIRYKVSVLKGSKEKVPTIEGRNRVGHRMLLYDEEQAKDFIEKVYLLQRKHKGNFWTQEKIESEALNIFKEAGTITYSVLRKLGRFDLAVAISRKYPGGFPGLREKLPTMKDEVPLISPEEAIEVFDRFFK